MELIESPMKVIMFRWNIDDGEIYVKITPTDTGIELHCDGDGNTELDYYYADDVNTMIIIPKLYVEESNVDN